MKLSYTTADGRLTVEIEGNSDKELFRKLAHFQEVFEDSPSAKVDGKILELGNGSVQYRVRKAKYIDDKNKEKEAEYFEKVVMGGPLSWYKKGYGVLDDGTDNLFPKKAPTDDPNIVAGNNGWHKYNKPQE